MEKDEVFQREDVFALVKVDFNTNSLKLEVDDSKLTIDDLMILLSKYMTTYLETKGDEDNG